MKNHLLSIFPSRGTAGYARVYLTPIYKTGVPAVIPFTVNREELTTLMRNCFLEHFRSHILATLDASSPAQIAVSNEDARILVLTTQESRAAEKAYEAIGASFGPDLGRDLAKSFAK